MTRMLVEAAQSGTQNSVSETQFRVRRPRPILAAEYAPQTIGLRAKALNCPRIVGVANPGRFARTSWWSIGDSNHEPLYAVARPRGVPSSIVRFARSAIRRLSDHTPNLAFEPDQNVRLWSQ
jgi:hypothetical protein